MNKYSEMSQWDLEEAVLKASEPGLNETQIEYWVISWSPSKVWDECYPVMDALLAITTGINLKSDGTATTEINGKQESAGGGHCRAICELYLMAKDSQNKLQNA